MSGLLAGVANSFFVAPIELCRTRAIISKDHKTTSTTDIIRNITRQDGFFSLWRGMGATMLRDGPGLGLYFYSFDCGKKLLGSRCHINPFPFTKE